jgi:CBS domain-containing protein/anti-sigma regulatory factor (Ser/Thr protein kinase)
MKNRFSRLTFPGKEEAFTKTHELVREMPVSQVMTAALWTISPGASMAELKELMREHRISGVPVVESGELLGIVSIEDLIRALAYGKLACPVQEFMTSGPLISADADEPVMEAVRRFEATKIGRMPVLDRQGSLVGILTRGDILESLLSALQAIYTESERTQEQPGHLFEALAFDTARLVLRDRVRPRDFMRGGNASTKIKQALLRIGASPLLARRVSIATYEAEMNLVIHTDQGGTITAEIEPAEIRVRTDDQGPGIADVDLACQPGYSTATAEVREMGFGAGMGLVNIKSCADAMIIRSVPGSGTCLEMVFREPFKEVSFNESALSKHD